MSELPTPEGGQTYYGVTIYELAEGDYLAAFGTHSKLRFLAACNAYARNIWSMGGLLDTDETLPQMVECVEHKLVEYQADTGVNEGSWYVDWHAHNPERDVPMTIISLW